jgi:adenosylmethionine-8-amino-7-oxononanoate aminotransferase
MQDSYPGDTLGSVSVGGLEVFHSLFHPLLFASTAVPVPRGPSADARAADRARCLQRLDAILDEDPNGYCALVMEPGVQGAAGIRVYPDGFTRAVVERARGAGLLIILDEVATGFGRSGELFAAEREDVEPDLLCLAKGLSGGYLPLAATLTTNRIFEAFLGEPEELRTFFHGHTFTGNPLACAAARASLALCRDEGFLPRARELGSRLETGLSALTDHAHVQEVRRYGSMVGIELVARRDAEQPGSFPMARRTGHRVTLAARNRGALVRPLGDTVVLMPPLSMSNADVDRLVEVTIASIDEATDGA